MAKRFEHGPTMRGYSPYDCVSAMQKAIRRSQPQQAVYWAMELYGSGHQTWMWNRLQEILSEDIGPADRYLPATIYALRETSDSKRKKHKWGGMEATHAVILMATAEKNGIACFMSMVASEDYHERFEIPDEAKDMHTRAGRKMGRGVDHFIEEGARKVQPETRVFQMNHDTLGEWLIALGLDYQAQWHEAQNGEPRHSNPKGNRDETWMPPADVKRTTPKLFDEEDPE
jgi:replication-associated recombination protein RarA